MGQQYQLLKIYLHKIGRPELYEQKSKNIWFFFGAQKLNYGDTTPVENIFKTLTSIVTVEGL